jgi:DNA-binding transcriptional regulator LsrR (DeoR family)
MPRPKKMDPSTADMLKAARMFYKDGRNKKEISFELHTDIREVSRILRFAQEQGVVRIQIFESADSSLGQSIQMKYPHLRKTFIARGGQIRTAEQFGLLLRQWAVLASDYFEELAERHPGGQPLHVAVGGGKHILEFTNAVPDRNRENVYVSISALVGRGRLPKSATQIDPIVNASVLWTHCGYLPGHCEYATVSPYVSTRPGATGREAVRIELGKVEANRTVRQVIEGMDNIDVLFGAIGVVDAGNVDPSIHDCLTISNLLHSVVTPDQLRKEGAAGSFSYCFFDRRGRQHEGWRFWLTAGHYSDNNWGIEFYKDMVRREKKVIAFGGPFALNEVKIALEAKIFNVWVTDEYTVRQILDGR